VEPVTTTAVLAAVGGALTTITVGWLKARVQREREESRRQHVGALPAGSRIIDLGERGILIEVGAQEGRAGGRR
jgi:hypothetical protein